MQTKRHLIWIAALALLSPGNIFADSLWQSFQVEVGARANTLLPGWLGGGWTQKQEDDAIAYEQQLERNEQEQKGLIFVGQVFLDDSAPTLDLTCCGSFTEQLTFGWVDPATGLATSSTGEAVASVQYYAWGEATESLDLSAWNLIGTGTNALDNFSLTYTFPFDESIVMAVPLNGSGGQIFIDGVGGYNDAWSLAMNTVSTTSCIPEPASFMLFGIGVVALTTRRQFAGARR